MSIYKSGVYKEMLQGLEEVVPGFDPRTAQALHGGLYGTHGRANLVCIGSSRHFPAGNMLYQKNRSPLTRHFNLGIMQGQEAMEAHHDGASVIFISNSGATGEICRPAEIIKESGLHGGLYAITTNPDSPLATQYGAEAIILPCEKETVIAATKTVLAQALLLHAAIRSEEQFSKEKMEALSVHLQRVFHGTDIPDDLITRMARASSVRLAGPNNGALAEMNLKFTEACGMNVHTYDGTEIIHGPTQSFHAAAAEDRDTEKDDTDVVVLFDPPSEWENSLKENIGKSGAYAWAVASRDTVFPTLRMEEFSENPEFRGYSQLVLGWALMLKIAEERKITAEEFDHPSRLSKVVNNVSPDL